MIVIELGAAGSEPVSLAEAKTWCRIDRTDEDALIGALIKAAREAIERETGLVLARRSFRLGIDEVPGDGAIRVPRRPFGRVTAVVAYGADGAPTSVAVSEVRMRPGVGMIEVPPTVRARAANGMDIEFEAGFAPGEVPEALRLAIRQIVAASYEVRAVVPPAMQPGLVPDSARRLVAPFREHRV